MERLNNFKPIIGDDLPYNTMYLRDIPSGFGFGALDYPTDRPLTYALKDKLNDFASDFYRNYEIVGNTFVDFQRYLQSDLMLNIDTLEKMLAVYNDDIAKPTQSRTIKRSYDIHDTTDIDGSNTSSSNSSSTIDRSDTGTVGVESTQDDTGTVGVESTQDDTGTVGVESTQINSTTVNSNVTNIEYDLPIDNPNGQATTKSTSDGSTGTEGNQNGSNTTTNNLKTARTETTTNNLKTARTETTTNNLKTSETGNTTNSNTNSENSNTDFKHTGSETEEWSDVGVAPNYVLLNGFIDNNRSYYLVFVNFFVNCFDLGEALYV